MRDSGSGELLDEAMALWFPGPGSYTGEDLLELHLHGGRAVVEGVTRLILAQTGVRMAEPGEFTRRAFEAGKMDLTEAEAVADLLDADTDAQRSLALSQLGGSLHRLYDGWAARLRMLLAHSEAVIDMGDEEEDVGDGVWSACAETAAELVAELQSHLDDGRRGELVRSGLTVALVGSPNAGKSTLVNALARSEVAIVSDVPGTTRDAVSTRLDMKGVPVTVVDTAGLRSSGADAVELEGIRRARERATAAELVAVVCDVGSALRGGGGGDPSRAVLAAADAVARQVLERSDADPSSRQDLQEEGQVEGGAPLEALKRLSALRRIVLVLSQADKVSADTTAGLAEAVTSASGLSPRLSAVLTSLAPGGSASDGVGALEAMLAERVKEAVGDGGDGPVLTRARHRAHLEDCVAALCRFIHAAGGARALPLAREGGGADWLEGLAGVQAGAMSADMAGEELRMAVGALARVTGTVDVEGVLDDVFASFCVGK